MTWLLRLVLISASAPSCRPRIQRWFSKRGDQLNSGLHKRKLRRGVKPTAASYAGCTSLNSISARYGSRDTLAFHPYESLRPSSGRSPSSVTKSGFDVCTYHAPESSVDPAMKSGEIGRAHV